MESMPKPLQLKPFSGGAPVPDSELSSADYPLLSTSLRMKRARTPLQSSGG